MPLVFRYRLGMSDVADLKLHAEPYAAYAVSGTLKQRKTSIDWYQIIWTIVLTLIVSIQDKGLVSE